MELASLCGLCVLCGERVHATVLVAQAPGRAEAMKGGQATLRGAGASLAGGPGAARRWFSGSES